MLTSRTREDKVICSRWVIGDTSCKVFIKLTSVNCPSLLHNVLLAHAIIWFSSELNSPPKYCLGSQSGNNLVFSREKKYSSGGWGKRPVWSLSCTLKIHFSNCKKGRIFLMGLWNLISTINLMHHFPLAINSVWFWHSRGVIFLRSHPLKSYLIINDLPCSNNMATLWMWYLYLTRGLRGINQNYSLIVLIKDFYPSNS